jgi:cell filamentation protein
LPVTAPGAAHFLQIFRRNRPYLIPGTTVLRNNFGVDSQTVLSELEFVAAHRRRVVGS